jgi:hypothetical protein
LRGDRELQDKVTMVDQTEQAPHHIPAVAVAALVLQVKTE